ncbi:unnamed protein product [Porites lobata]|uniref:Uncharacterized protein n=1 Tax=Porites lobata TaxID=104759 RepID=A0ABN8Q7S3_9CNID|nr:unnamed protein product [Porites lobata]
MKVGLLLNHISEPCLEIYSNFTYLPERDDPAGGEEKLPAEDSDNYATVVAKFGEYFQKRDPQLMLREKFWLHLKREPTQTFDSWVVTVKERAAECNLGLIHEIPGTYSVKAVHQMPDSHPLQSGTKEDIVKQYPSLFQGLGKLEGEHTIQLKEGPHPFV